MCPHIHSFFSVTTPRIFHPSTSETHQRPDQPKGSFSHAPETRFCPHAVLATPNAAARANILTGAAGIGAGNLACEGGRTTSESEASVGL